MTIYWGRKNIINAAIQPRGSLDEISGYRTVDSDVDLLFICTFHHFFCASLDKEGAPTGETTILCPAFAKYIVPQGYWGRGDPATSTRRLRRGRQEDNSLASFS